MKQVFIIKENNPKLLIFFAGWAADETPFKQYRPKDMDYMICYDYRTLDFDTTILDNYRQVNVVAWSMGVWAASRVLKNVPREKLFCIAFNGTEMPINDSEGIPVEIYHNTLLNLTPASLQKFLRRMCKDSDAFRAFLEITPRRDFNEIKQELELIEKQYTQSLQITIDENHNYIFPDEDEDVFDDYFFDYDLAFIGKEDRIFPFKNLQLISDPWDDKVIAVNCAHYDEPMFRFLLQDAWSMSVNDFIFHLREINEAE